MSINYRLNIIFWGLILLMGLPIMFTFFTLEDQKIHGIKINMAGRQRMLTQRMAMESHDVLMGNNSARKSLSRDADNFDTNLNILSKGGEISDGKKIIVLKVDKTAMEGKIQKQLEKVGGLWLTFHKNLNVIIDEGARPLAMEFAARYIKNNYNLLIQELETTVKLFEVNAAEDISKIKLWQVSFLLLAILLNLTALFILSRTIVKPINRLRDVTSRIAKGNLSERVPACSNHEVGRLAESFNEMAKQLEESYSLLKNTVSYKTDKLKRQEEILGEAQQIASVGNWDWDIISNELTISDEFYRIFGLDTHELSDLNEDLRKRIHPKDMDRVDKKVYNFRVNFEEYNIDYQIVRPDNQVAIVHEEAIVKTDESGDPIRLVRTIQDITTKRKTEGTEKKLLRVIEQSPVSIVITDMNGNIEYVNPKFTEISGYTFDEAIGLNPRVLKSGLQDAVFYQELWDTISSGKEWCGEFHNKKKNGELFWEHATISPIMNEKGEVTNYVAVKEDVTKQKKIDSEIKKLSSAIEQSINMVFISDLKGNIEYVNAMFEKVTGYLRDEVINKNLLDFIATKISDDDYEALKKNVSSGENWKGTYQSKRKDGTTFWASTLTSPLMDEKGKLTHLISIQEDITKKKEADERLEYLASYDSLTGLINRSRFMDLMNEWILFAEHTNEIGAFMLIDIDNFTVFNDIYGHNTGDQYLKSMAEQMQSTLRENISSTSAKDGLLIGRMGSDEFAILIPGIGPVDGIFIAENVRKSIEEHRLTNIDYNLTVSIGIALYPEHGKSRQELFLKGDAAIQRANELGQNVCHLYLPEDNYLEEMHSKYEWKKRIMEAIKENRFEIWAQPILDLNNDQVYHYEILVRMIDKDGSIVSPGMFINMAELFGLVGQIDRLVAEKAMTFLAMKASEGEDISISINLSGKDLEDDGILRFMQEKICETGAAPSSIHFEITETAAINDLERAIKLIQSLKDMGCKFALDDFGVGFTSFVYLRDMPVDYLKIDGSFIKNLHQSKNDQLFVKAITDVAHGMGIKIIAEFVEEKETITYLKEYGVDYGQGYYIGKPKPASQLLN